MEYYVGISSSDKARIEITLKEFNSLKRAQSILGSARAMEEKYDILISNYISLENYLLCMTTELMLRKDLGYSNFFDLMHNFNIQMVNLLTSARLYLDQVNRDIKGAIPDKKGIYDKIALLKSKEYDTNQDYQFMEALRNYVQHCGLPVHLTDHILSKDGANDFFEYTLSFYAKNSLLRKDSLFKSSVLEGLKENIDLKASVRGYLESLSRIHESLRGLIKLSINEARELITQCYNKYRKAGENNLGNLYAFKNNGKGVILSIPLILSWDDSRIELTKKNTPLLNLKKRYISSIIKAKT